MREEGIYKVVYHGTETQAEYSINEFGIAEWTIYDIDNVYEDDDFDEIGPKIELPS